MSDIVGDFLPEYRYFLDKSTVLFGESETGKSTIITDILYHLRGHIDQIIVFSPTDKQNKNYTDIAPLPCIHYEVNARIVHTIWERQKAIADTYKKVTDPGTVESLFSRTKKYNEYRKIINMIKHREEKTNKELRETLDAMTANAQIKIAGHEYQRLIDTLVKKAILDEAHILARMDISEKEKYSLKYLDMNPRIVIIFDDCTDQIERMKKNQTLQKMFWEGRHSYVTFIIACHHDKALPSELKSNTFVSIFTESTCADMYRERASNMFTRPMKTRWSEAIQYTFKPELPYQKLVWIRVEKRFYKWTADKHDKFRFGSKQVWDFCKMIESTTGPAVNNEFSRDFM